MSRLRILSASEQVTEHLRGELLGGRWTGAMPGTEFLAKELGVGIHTVAEALHNLEKDRVLISQGHRRSRRIVLTEGTPPPGLRIAILPYEPLGSTGQDIFQLLRELQAHGHTAFFAKKSLSELKMNVKRVAHMVGQTEAALWIVVAAPRHVLEWFIDHKIPVFARAGSRRGLSIAGAGPDKSPPLRDAIRRLVELGHRRIVMLLRRGQRPAQPTPIEKELLSELDALGIPAGTYNLPGWEDTPEGFRRCLETLFRHTPPTALITDEGLFVVAVQQFCMGRGLRVPEDLSLVCTDADPCLERCEPSISCIRWYPEKDVKSIVRWVDKFARGREDRRQTFSKAEFIEGGTIGPAPKER